MFSRFLWDFKTFLPRMEVFLTKIQSYRFLSLQRNKKKAARIKEKAWNKIHAFSVSVSLIAMRHFISTRVRQIHMKLAPPYVYTVRIIFKTPPAKYFVHGVLNMMKAVSTKATLISRYTFSRSSHRRQEPSHPCLLLASSSVFRSGRRCHPPPLLSLLPAQWLMGCSQSQESPSILQLLYKEPLFPPAQLRYISF